MDNFRQLPHNIMAEQAVIGGLMISSGAWWKVCETITTDDFFRPDHKILFSVIAENKEAGHDADPVTIYERLEAKGLVDQAGGMQYLGLLANETPSAANIKAHAKIVKDLAVRRELITKAQDVLDLAFGDLDSDVASVVDNAQSVFMGLNQNQQGDAPKVFDNALSDLLNELQRRFELGGAITGLSTGFSKIDEFTCGLQNGDLIVLAARPSMGKTTLAGNVIENIGIKDKKPVLFFSLEMTSVSIAERFLASLSGLNHGKIRKAQFEESEWAKVTNFISQSRKSGLYIDETPKLSINQIRARARIHKQRHGLGLIVVDYLTEMAEPKAHSRRDAVGANIKGLKALAKELEVPVLCLAQLNREVGNRSDRRPQLTDLGVSGDIEQTADIVMMLHREAYYDESFPHPNIAELIFRKNRNGETGTVCLDSDLAHMRFLSSEFNMDNYLARKAEEKENENKNRGFSR